ncbi:fibroblast growth factor receptor 1-like isoform X2 [Ptychodera flava]|uniref:fibroblast growth factor receptor 1-like isoform X2 n=1 Tax=Ptychodera flava TaxID=63121 RepID=UPI00396A8125
MMVNYKMNWSLLLMVTGILTTVSASSYQPKVDQTATVQVGNDAVLHCPHEKPAFNYQSMTATWNKWKEDNGWFTVASASNTVSTTDPERYTITSQYSLVIRSVQPADECLYKCIVNYKLTEATSHNHPYHTQVTFVKLYVTDPMNDLPISSKSSFGKQSISTVVKFDPTVKIQTDSLSVTSRRKMSPMLSSDGFKQKFHMKGMMILIAATCVVIVILIAGSIWCWRRTYPRYATTAITDVENQAFVNQHEAESRLGKYANDNEQVGEDKTTFTTVIDATECSITSTLLESNIIASPESGFISSDQNVHLIEEYQQRSTPSYSDFGKHSGGSAEMTESKEGGILEVTLPAEDDATSTASSGTTTSEESLVDRPLTSSYVHVEHDREVSRSDIVVEEQLGEGRFGKVFKGCLRLPAKNGRKDVAIKILPACISAEEYKDLIRELDVMKKLKPHPRVVRLLASCTLPKEDPIYVIVEYVSNGSLKNYLRKNRPVNSNSVTGSMQKRRALTDKDLIKFAIQVAEGMDYLHQNNCIHRDLAARNILVTSDINCKISDFGLARNIGNNEEYVTKSQGPLPLRWEAPESLTSNVYNFKSDVWSYGILLWEIVTFGKRPYPDLDSCEDVRRKVKRGYTMPVPEHCHKGLCNIIKNCWQRDAQKRPSFARLVADLKNKS